MKTLYDQYRPIHWEQVVGQQRALRQIFAVRNRGIGGRAFWISGPSGSGKTTIARLIGGEIADPENIIEVESKDLTRAALADLETSMSYFGFGKGGRAYLVNEAHGLTSDTIRRLLIVLERIPDHVVLVFTTTSTGEADFMAKSDDATPFISRCVKITLDANRTAFAQRVQQIALWENLDGQPIDAYLDLADRCNCNMRAMLQEVESGAMLGDKPLPPPTIAPKSVCRVPDFDPFPAPAPMPAAPPPAPVIIPAYNDPALDGVAAIVGAPLRQCDIEFVKMFARMKLDVLASSVADAQKRGVAV